MSRYISLQMKLQKLQRLLHTDDSILQSYSVIYRKQITFEVVFVNGLSIEYGVLMIVLIATAFVD